MEQMENMGLRLHSFEKGVKMWQIADRLGMRQETLSRKLRHALPDEETKKILRIIDEIAAGKEDAE